MGREVELSIFMMLLYFLKVHLHLPLSPWFKFHGEKFVRFFCCLLHLYYICITFGKLPFRARCAELGLLAMRQSWYLDALWRREVAALPEAPPLMYVGVSFSICRRVWRLNHRSGRSPTADGQLHSPAQLLSSTPACVLNAWSWIN